MQNRLQNLNSNVYCGLQAQRTTLHVGRLPPKRHDMCQLSEIARLLEFGRYAASYEYCY
jgi:hypothetical protein